MEKESLEIVQEEIANMLSGAQVSQAAIENAKQLLNL